MNTKLKIFMIILTITSLSTSANATKLDDNIKKQCQHTVYGNGEYDIVTDMYLLGVVSGMQFLISDQTKFAENSKYGVKVHKACQNALNNISALGFEGDFKVESLKLLSKKYSKIKR